MDRTGPIVSCKRYISDLYLNFCYGSIIGLDGDRSISRFFFCTAWIFRLYYIMMRDMDDAVAQCLDTLLDWIQSSFSEDISKYSEYWNPWHFRPSEIFRSIRPFDLSTGLGLLKFQVSHSYIRRLTDRVYIYGFLNSRNCVSFMDTNRMSCILNVTLVPQWTIYHYWLPIYVYTSLSNVWLFAFEVIQYYYIPVKISRNSVKVYYKLHFRNVTFPLPFSFLYVVIKYERINIL